MSKLKDLTNKRFGYLVAISIDKSAPHKRTKWFCKCDCGNTTIVPTCDLTSGHTTSCGCKKHETKNTTHGLSNTRIYSIWCGMKKRCYNPQSKAYTTYGSKGITLCDEWKNDFLSFYQWAMSNGYSDVLTIDRIDNEKGYSPENCRWTTHSEQQCNRTNNVFVVYKGKKITLSELSQLTNIPYKKLHYQKTSALRKKGCFDVSDLL